jgi:hypothetical protein
MLEQITKFLRGLAEEMNDDKNFVTTISSLLLYLLLTSLEAGFALFLLLVGMYAFAFGFVALTGTSLGDMAEIFARVITALRRFVRVSKIVNADGDTIASLRGRVKFLENQVADLEDHLCVAQRARELLEDDEMMRTRSILAAQRKLHRDTPYYP